MSTHADWVSASTSHFAFVTPGGFYNDSSRNDGPALVLWYDEAVVLEGTVDELRARLEQGLAVLNEAPAAMQRYAADQRFRETLVRVKGELEQVQLVHEDTDEALALIQGVLVRLWDALGNPIDAESDEPRELLGQVPYANSMADTAAGPGSN